jgi:ubiquinone/menaquinone biosynthesis C-methylase UbiE
MDIRQPRDEPIFNPECTIFGVPQKRLVVPVELQRRLDRLKASGNERAALEERAQWSAEQRFGESLASKRKQEARVLLDARRRDLKPSTKFVRNWGTRGWDASFAADLEDLAFYYHPFRVEKIVTALARQNPTRPVRTLEIGAGAGRAAAGLEKRLGNTIEMHATGVAYIPIWKTYHNSARIQWHALHAGTLVKKFPAESFDFVHSNFGFSQARDIVDALHQVHQILKPNGLFLFTGIPADEYALDQLIQSNFTIVKKVKRTMNERRDPEYLKDTFFVYLLRKKTANTKPE